MGTVQNLCPRAIWLESGDLWYDGGSAEAVRLYVDRMNAVASSTVGEYVASATRRGTGEVRFTSVAVVDEHGCSATTFRMGDTIRIVAQYCAFRAVLSPDVWFAIRECETNVLVTSVRRSGFVLWVCR